MDKLVKEVFEDECSQIVFDAKFLKRLNAFQVGFVNKNEEHVAFFGGHLLGVHKVRFSNADVDRWFEEIVEADEYLLKERLHNLPGINAEFKVSSDVFNLSCVWLTHAIYLSPKLTEKQKEEGMIDVMLVLHYRYITSRIVRHFPYAADPEVAEATYAQLSYKFAIKNQGTWFNVLKARAVDVISRESIHYQAIVKMDDNNKVVALLNDTQGRIRDMVKNIVNVFLTTSRQGIKIGSTSDVVEFDGGDILRDKTKGLINYKQYLKAVLSDKTSFIKDELVSVVERIMKTMPPRLFRQSLEWMSDHYGQSSTGVIEEVLDEVLTHSFTYLGEHRSLVRNSVNLAGLIGKLKGVYMSSRSTDPSLLLIREKVEEIVQKATGNKNKNIIASVRTGIMLYLVCRTYTKNHYS